MHRFHAFDEARAAIQFLRVSDYFIGIINEDHAVAESTEKKLRMRREIIGRRPPQIFPIYVNRASKASF
jgi:hypothetical protein